MCVSNTASPGTKAQLPFPSPFGLPFSSCLTAFLSAGATKVDSRTQQRGLPMFPQPPYRVLQSRCYAPIRLSVLFLYCLSSPGVMGELLTDHWFPNDQHRAWRTCSATTADHVFSPSVDFSDPLVTCFFIFRKVEETFATPLAVSATNCRTV